MTILVIRTQYLENYGTSENPYWKAKGGSEYKITNVPLNTDYEKIVSLANVEKNDAFQEEYIVNWSIEADDYLSWFEKSQLEYDGSIAYPEPTIEYTDLIEERMKA